MERRDKKPLILSVGSGKGGVGKTLTTVNMGLAASRLGYRTLILDGDLGMANVDIVLGLKARYNINDALEERVSFEDILLEGPLGLRIMPSGSGLATLADLSMAQRVQLLDKIQEVAQNFDLLIIDTGAGISESVLHLNAIADAIMLVTTQEPHALKDALAFAKVISARYGKRSINVIVNQATTPAHGIKVFQGLADVAKSWCGIELSFAGTVPRDSALERAVMLQRAGDEQVKHTLAGQAWNEITRRMLELLREAPQADSGRGFSDLIFPQFGARSIRAL